MARKNETAPETTTDTVDATADDVQDFSAFTQAAHAAIEGADKTTGDITEDGLKSSLDAYRGLANIKTRNAAKSWADDETKAAIMGGDILKARSVMAIKENLSSGAARTPAAPKDPTDAFVNKVAQLQLAASLVGADVPEGVSADWTEKVEGAVATLREEFEKFSALGEDDSQDGFTPAVKKVARLIAGKASGNGPSYDGPRRNVGTHIGQAFESLPSGSFLTVTELAKAESAEYGDDHPTTGAISARLFPSNGSEAKLPEGITAVIPEDGSARGASKA